MALSSDETIKREIIDHVGHNPYGYEARVFFEGSNDDQKLFQDGGLTFSKNNQSYGSCDCVYIKQDQKNEGGIINKEMPITLSNLMLLDKKTKKGTRVGYSFLKDNKKVRINVKTGEQIDG